MVIRFNAVIKTSQDAVDFCYTAEEFPRYVHIRVECDGNVADGKSILSMLSLRCYNSNSTVAVIVSSDCEINEENVRNRFNPWITEEVI